MIKKAYKNHKETIHNFIWRSLQTFGKQGITFLIFIICAKLLVPYEFGLYNYVLAIIFFLIIFGDFGISTATSKYVAEYNATDKKKLKLVLFNSGIIILGLTILITILTLIFGPYFLGDKYVYVLYLLPLIFLAPMTSLYDGIYRGLKQFKKLAIISLIVGLVSLSFVYILINQYGLIGALIAQNLFYLILFVALALGYREFSFKWDKKVMREIGRYSIIVGLSGIGYFFFTRIDILILGHFGYIIEIGYYEIVNKIILLIGTPILILSSVISPDITKLYIKKDIQGVYNRLKKYIFLSFLLGLILSIITFLLFGVLINSILTQYNNPKIFITLNIFLVIFIIQSVSGIVGNGFSISTGHAKINLYILLIFAALNLILDCILIGSYGYNGLIYTKMIVGISANILQIFIYFKILGRESNGK